MRTFIAAAVTRHVAEHGTNAGSRPIEGFAPGPLRADTRTRRSAGSDKTRTRRAAATRSDLNDAPAPPTLSDVLRQLNSMGSQFRCVATENLHVTLKFLGETPRRQILRIKAAMQDVTENLCPFHWEAIDVGVFPNRRRPAVVWAGVQPAAQFAKIAEALDERLQLLGFQPENRTYRPHLTLCRIRSRLNVGLDDWLGRLSGHRFAAAEMRELHLYESCLRGGKVCYRILESVQLKPQGE